MKLFKFKMTYGKAMMFATIMVAAILVPVLVGTSFALFTYNIPPYITTGILVGISLLALLLFPKHMREFALQYK